MDFLSDPTFIQVVKIIGGIAVALLLLWLLRWRIIYSLIWILRPTVEPSSPGPGLDYANIEAWFAHPGKEKDTASGDIPGYPDRQSEAQAAVFFIHPTSFFSRKHWNKPVTLETKDGFLEGAVLPNQAPVFTGEFKIYIPKYPQVTFATFATKSPRADQALEIAAAELERAFEQFLAEIGEQPFILAGHSQGSYMAVALLARAVAGTPLMDRLIAVYAPGYFFPEDLFAEIGVPLCQDLDSNGCVQTWNAVSRAHWLPPFLLNKPQPAGLRPAQRGQPLRYACTNPLHPGAEQVPAEDNLGAYLGGYFPVKTPFVPHLTGARVAGSRLVIDDIEDKRFKRALMSSGWYHAYEYGLFFANIRADVERRLAHWRAKH